MVFLPLVASNADLNLNSAEYWRRCLVITLNLHGLGGHAFPLYQVGQLLGPTIGHRILVIAYHVLRDQQEYREPIPLALDEQRRRRARNRAVDQLRQLGFAVTLTPKEDAA